MTDSQSRSANGAPIIVLSGPFPPPVHGMAAVNNSILTQLLDKNPLIINLSRELTGSTWMSYVKKTVRALHGCLKILTLPTRRIKVFYSSVDDGLAGLFVALFAQIARLRNCRIILHHHSYRYIIRRTWIMNLLVRTGGKNATHVFLCDSMEHDFRALYPGSFRALICPNPVIDPTLIAHFGSPPDSTPKSHLTIGFLSNLMFEKGIREFIDVIRQAPAHGINLRGIMAGSAFKAEAQEYLNDVKQELGERLELLGAVHGERKIKFFKSIDLLIFPTSYPSEAFSIVLMEGLLSGCPLITYGRGCIPILSNLQTVRVLHPEEDFIPAALSIIFDWSRSDEKLSELKSQAHRDGIALHRTHSDTHYALIQTIIGAKHPSRKKSPQTGDIEEA